MFRLKYDFLLIYLNGNIDEACKSKNKLQDSFARSANNPQFYHKPSFLLLLWLLTLRFLFLRILLRLLIPFEFLFVRILIQVLLLLLIFQFISIFVLVVKCFKIFDTVEKCLSVVANSTDWILR